MKRFILGFVLAISIPAFAAAIIWPSGVYIETFQNGFKFGTGKILSVLNDVITFDGKRLDDADKDIFFQEDFEGAAVSFTCDANIAAADDTGLMGSDTSKSFTQSIGAQDEICYSDNIAFAGAQEGKLCLVSSGSTNWDLKVYDVTNSSYLGTAPLRGNSNQDCVWFEGEDTTANIRYELVVRIEENTDELIIDNVKAKYFPFETGDIYASSETEDYTPTTQGLGTPTINYAKWYRDGEYAVLNLKITSGTVTANELQIGLPNDLVADEDYSLDYLGTLEINAVNSNHFSVLATGGDTFLNVGFRGGGAANLFTAVNANAFMSNGDTITLSDIRVKIAGWTNTKKSVTVKNTTSTDIASENNFDAIVSITGVVSGENYDWINGDCSVSSGVYTCDINLTLTEPLICSSGKIQGANPGYDVLFNNSSSDINFVTKTDGNSTASAGPFNIRCSRRGDDFVKERDRIYTFAADSLTGNYVRAEGVDSTSYTANTPIPYTEIKDNANAYSSGVYTVQKNNSKIDLSGVLSDSGPVDTDIFLYKNGTSYKYLFNGRSTYLTGSREFTYISTRGEFSAGDTLSIRASNGLTLQTAASFVYLNISEEYGDRGTFVGQFGQPTCFYRVNTPGNVSFSSEVGSTSYTQNNINRQEGSCDFSSVASDQITLKKGTYNYRIPIGAVDNTAYVDARLYDGSTALKEHLSLAYSAAGNAIFSNEARGQITLNSDTTIRIDTRADNNSGTMYLFDFEFTKVR